MIQRVFPGPCPQRRIRPVLAGRRAWASCQVGRSRAVAGPAGFCLLSNPPNHQAGESHSRHPVDLLVIARPRHSCRHGGCHFLHLPALPFFHDVWSGCNGCNGCNGLAYMTKKLAYCRNFESLRINPLHPLQPVTRGQPFRGSPELPGTTHGLPSRYSSGCH